MILIIFQNSVLSRRNGQDTVAKYAGSKAHFKIASRIFDKKAAFSAIWEKPLVFPKFILHFGFA
jgi:hypothetical protein